MLLDNTNTERPFDWNKALDDAGYIGVEIGFSQAVSIPYCDLMFGKDHYVWTGSKFWFENQHDAVIFTLKWS